MSLIVNVYQRGEDGAIILLDSPNHSEELAGVEVCRQQLWGAASTRSLGLTLLPSLAESDLYAEGDDLTQLGQEAQTILENVAFLARETGYGDEYIAFRTRNILSAVERAKQVAQGGVVVF